MSELDALMFFGGLVLLLIVVVIGETGDHPLFLRRK